MSAPHHPSDRRPWRLHPLRHWIWMLALLAIEVGIATQLRNGGWIRGSLGDFLAVIWVYHLGQCIHRLPPLPMALWALGVGLCVELAQALHLADALGLPHGHWMRILIGTHFSWGDIVMYSLGGWVVYLYERRINPQG